MLDLMRKQAGSWMIKFVLGAIIVVFAFWGVGTFNAQRLTTVAKVDDTIITFEEYRDAYGRLMDQMRERFGEHLDDTMLKALNLKQQAIEQLLNDRLLINEAGRLGLEVTDAELTRAIGGIGAFRGETGFDPDRYRRVLSANRLSPENFEYNQRQAMLIDKLRTMVVETVKVADSEARQWYNFANARVSLDLVRIDPDGFGDVTIAEADLQPYYDAHKEDYRTEPKRRARYLFFDPAAFSDQAVVSDEEIEEYYAANTAEFRQETNVEARHVLIRTAETDSPEAVEAARQRILEVEKKARAGEDFAELARAYSECPSASQGGNLGRFGRRQMVEPFAEKAFSMKPGEISEPVKTQFGWHLIKVEQIYPEVTQELAKVSASIRTKLAELKARTMAFEAADDAWETAYDAGDLEPVAKARQLDLHRTDLFGRKGPDGAAVAEKEKFATAVFGLPDKEISDVQEMRDGYYIVQMVEEESSRIPDLAAIRDTLSKDTLEAKRGEKARQEAQTILAAARGGEDLAALAAARGLKVDNTGLFGRTGQIPTVGQAREMTEVAFGLSQASPWPDRVLNIGKHWYVLRLAERQGPEEAGFAQQKDQIVKQLMQQKQYETFDTLLAQLRSQSAIEIKTDMLD